MGLSRENVDGLIVYFFLEVYTLSIMSKHVDIVHFATSCFVLYMSYGYVLSREA